jgi:transposase
MGPCSTASFAQRFFKLKLPKGVTQLVEPLLETIIELSERIAKLDKELAAESDSDELMVRLQEVPGVGPLVCLAYVAWMDRASRFRRSREVGACLGLRPQVRDSGEKTWRGPISREGDSEMRRLLVQAAHAFLLRRQDSALRRWAERLIQRVGKRKAVVALARKLGVLLHRLWATGDSYRPFPNGLKPA